MAGSCNASSPGVEFLWWVAIMSSWHDYIDIGVLLPAAGWLVATYVALHGLWLAKNDSKRRMLVFGAYSLVAVAVVSVTGPPPAPRRPPPPPAFVVVS